MEIHIKEGRLILQEGESILIDAPLTSLTEPQLQLYLLLTLEKGKEIAREEGNLYYQEVLAHLRALTVDKPRTHIKSYIEGLPSSLPTLS
jgi:hypothetical protein